MQCPKCKYEHTLSEIQSSPDDCVKCGVNYARHAEMREQVRAERAANASRASRPAAVREAEMQYPGAQPVVIVDLNMSFGAMVRFMVKWAIASIPALIILALLFAGLLAFLGIFGGVLRTIGGAT